MILVCKCHFRQIFPNTEIFDAVQHMQVLQVQLLIIPVKSTKSGEKWVL